MAQYFSKLVFFSFAFVPVFLNLGGPHLWEDEASTALLGKSILAYGVPKPFDGLNRVSDTPDFREANESGIWTWNTWLPYYATAFSFFLGEPDSFHARLPFAIAGFLCILSMPWVYRELKGSSGLQLLPSFLLVLSVPFLLHVRQCRYYSFAALFTLLSVWGYLRMLQEKKWGGALFVLSNVLLFHSFYILLPVNLFCIGLHFLIRKIFFPDEIEKVREKEFYKNLLPALGIIVLCAFPFALWAGYLSGNNSQDISFEKFFLFLKINALWINFFLCPFLLAAVFAWTLEFRKLGAVLFFLSLVFGLSVHLENSFAGLYLLPLAALGSLFYLMLGLFQKPFHFSGMGKWSLPLVYCLLYPLIFSLAAPFPFYRYLIPMVPLAILPLSACLERLWEKQKGLAVIITTLWLGSNLLAWLPAVIFNPLFTERHENAEIYTLVPYESFHWTRLRFDLWDYAREITRPSMDLNGLIVRYLSEHGKPGDIIKASYEELPLMFHTPFRVYNRFERGEEVPDWIILRTGYPFIRDAEYVNGLFKEYDFEAIGFLHKNVPWNDNRPDPLYHLFSPPLIQKPDPVIFKRTG